VAAEARFGVRFRSSEARHFESVCDLIPVIQLKRSQLPTNLPAFALWIVHCKNCTSDDHPPEPRSYVCPQHSPQMKNMRLTLKWVLT
jgi:hypothetical protein